MHRLPPDFRIDEAEAAICYSRCLVCGRRTPHELCTDHEDPENWPRPVDKAWGTGYNKPPETCDVKGCIKCQ